MNKENKKKRRIFLCILVASLLYYHLLSVNAYAEHPFSFPLVQNNNGKNLRNR